MKIDEDVGLETIYLKDDQGSLYELHFSNLSTEENEMKYQKGFPFYAILNG